MHPAAQEWVDAQVETTRRTLTATAEMTCAIAEAAKANGTLKSLAEKFGISITTVHKHLTRAKTLGISDG